MWIYNGRAVTNDDTADQYGFVYRITNLTNGRQYIGRKYLTKAGRKTVKGKTKKVRVSSGWENYWGSNDALKEDLKVFGPDLFKREIIRFCKRRADVSYWETYHILTEGALLGNNWYNSWVSCKIHKNHLTQSEN